MVEMRETNQVRRNTVPAELVAESEHLVIAMMKTMRMLTLYILLMMMSKIVLARYHYMAKP